MYERGNASLAQCIVRRRFMGTECLASNARPNESDGWQSDESSAISSSLLA